MAVKMFIKNIFFGLICFLLPILFMPADISFAKETGEVISVEVAQVKDKKDSTSDEEEEDEEDC